MVVGAPAVRWVWLCEYAPADHSELLTALEKVSQHCEHVAIVAAQPEFSLGHMSYYSCISLTCLRGGAVCGCCSFCPRCFLVADGIIKGGPKIRKQKPEPGVVRFNCQVCEASFRGFHANYEGYGDRAI